MELVTDNCSECNTLINEYFYKVLNVENEDIYEMYCYDCREKLLIKATIKATESGDLTSIPKTQFFFSLIYKTKLSQLELANKLESCPFTALIFSYEKIYENDKLSGLFKIDFIANGLNFDILVLQTFQYMLDEVPEAEMIQFGCPDAPFFEDS